MTEHVKEAKDSLSKPLRSSLDEHLTRVRKEITGRAYEIAEAASNSAGIPGEDSPVQPNLEQLAQAAAEVIKGSKVKEVPIFFRYIPPFTIVCAILCIVFAGFGYLAVNTQNTDLKTVTSGFLDIAKIFAGAIVGSTASSVINSSKTRR